MDPPKVLAELTKPDRFWQTVPSNHAMFRHCVMYRPRYKVKVARRKQQQRCVFSVFHMSPRRSSEQKNGIKKSRKRRKTQMLYVTSTVSFRVSARESYPLNHPGPTRAVENWVLKSYVKNIKTTSRVHFYRLLKICIFYIYCVILKAIGLYISAQSL